MAKFLFYPILIILLGCGKSQNKLGEPFVFPEALKAKDVPSIEVPQLGFWFDLEKQTKNMANESKEYEWHWKGKALLMGDAGEVKQHLGMEVLIKKGMSGHLRHLLANGGIYPSFSWDKLMNRQYCLTLNRSFGLPMLQLQKVLEDNSIKYIQLKYGPFNFKARYLKEDFSKWLKVEAETIWGELWELEGAWKNRITWQEELGDHYLTLSIPEALIQSMHRDETHLLLCLSEPPKKNELGPNLIYYKNELKTMPPNFLEREEWSQFFEFKGGRLYRAFGLENAYFELEEIQKIQGVIKSVKEKKGIDPKILSDSINIISTKMQNGGVDSGFWLIFTKDQWSGEIFQSQWPDSPFILAYFPLSDILGQFQAHLGATVDSQIQNTHIKIRGMRPGEKVWLKLNARVMKQVKSDPKLIHLEGKVKICERDRRDIRMSVDIPSEKFMQCNWVLGWCSVLNQELSWEEVPFKEIFATHKLNFIQDKDNIKFRMNGIEIPKDNVEDPYFFDGHVYWPLKIPKMLGPLTFELPTIIETENILNFGWVRDVACGHRHRGTDFTWINYAEKQKENEKFQFSWEASMLAAP